MASEGVTLLDPAAGTMTFVARATQEAVREFESKYGTGGREEFIRRHILGNFYAFELMMAPYAVGHLKMSFFLEELGHRLADDERVRFYLTNTLDMEELAQSRLPGFSSLAEESHLAGEVKKQTPILVILGNPPYSFSSRNQGEWIKGLIEDYKQIDGSPIAERKIGGIQDDYVKFLRFAQWKIDQAGRGVVGMITNHSYLDSLTFRGMRHCMMQSFDEICVLDLHGSTLKREVCPDGSPDQNVFDIRQGVAIAFFIKRGASRHDECTVQHADLWGTREQKYEWLRSHDFPTTPFAVINPEAHFYFFLPRSEKSLDVYMGFASMVSMFPTNGVGIITRKDKLTIRWSKDDVWSTVLNFSRLESELARRGYALGKDTANWSVGRAQEDLRGSGPHRSHVLTIAYRPFDMRYTYYTGKSNGFHSRPCREVMQHMLKPNLAFVVCRQLSSQAWSHAMVTERLTVCCLVSNRTREIGYLVPLYLYPESGQEDLFAQHDSSEGRPNLNPALVSALAHAYKRDPSPEQVFYYTYAVLHAPTYRDKYAEFLRTDFPRIPFTADYEVFEALAAQGARLVALHLLKSPDLDPPAARFEGEGDARVAKSKGQGLRYDAEAQRVYVNKTQYFAPVPAAVWKYQIGGYQVCEKWLKDRRERRLDLDEIRTYCRIVTALQRTIAIQSDIDAIYPAAEETTVSMEDEIQPEPTRRRPRRPRNVTVQRAI